MTTQTQPNPYADAWQQFQTNTKDHELTILHEDGLYRHLRMAAPGSYLWSWTIVTWPGYLAIAGDIGDGHTFSRLPDMVEFFEDSQYGTYPDGAPRINPGYWAEKLGRIQRGTEKKYSPDKFVRRVREALADHDGPINTHTVLDDAWDASADEHEAREWALEHADVLGQDFFWEVDLSDFDHHYLLACYAIAETIRHYKKERQP